MQSSLRALSRSIPTTRSVRSLHAAPAPEQALSKYPPRIGGVHYQEGDRVIVFHRDGRRTKSKLIPPLKLDGTTITGQHGYEIKHEDIIGKPAGRLYVDAPSTSKKGKSTTFRVAYPSLDEFISLAPRTVTPIYSSYGATISTLLDIHVAPPLPTNDPETSDTRPLEILEAGTGNGGLTLHLARTIAAANPPPPYLDVDSGSQEVEESWDRWRAKRRAIIHTVEYEASRSRAAERLIKSFRGALYWPHVNFNSGDVAKWVEEEIGRRRQTRNSSGGFLDVVILDLPAVHKQIQHVVEAMKDNAQLLVWVPQITQVAACQHQIENLILPFKLQEVIELGEGISNGRHWDLRFVKTRVEQNKELEASRLASTDGRTEGDAPVDESDMDTEMTPPTADGKVPQSKPEFPTMVCRPIVGELIMGGGFVGLWRKVSRSQPENSIGEDSDRN